MKDKIAGPITQMTIARIAGVSRPIVSLALSNDPRVALKTKEKVQQIARELNYHPDMNFDARRLALRQRSILPRFKTIGIHWSAAFGGFMENSYQRKILQGILKACLDYELACLIIQMPEESREMFARLSHIDGLIMFSPSDQVFHIAKSLGKPLVGIMGLHEMANVQIRNKEAVKIAYDHLRACGHERIGYFGPFIRKHDNNAIERKRALAGFLKKDGIFSSENFFETDRFIDYSGEIPEMLDASLDRIKKCSALIVYNDTMALTLLLEFSRRGIRVPEDISMIGIDGLDESAQSSPALTSVSYDLNALGVKAVEQMEKVIQNPLLLDQVIIPCFLVERDSVSKITKTRVR